MAQDQKHKPLQGHAVSQQACFTAHCSRMSSK